MVQEDLAISPGALLDFFSFLQCQNYVCVNSVSNNLYEPVSQYLEQFSKQWNRDDKFLLHIAQGGVEF